MPFQSLLSNPGTNLSLTGKPARGVSVPRIYSFVSVPTSIGEKNLGANEQYKNIDVNCVNCAAGTTLYWTILHQTTSAGDFLYDKGTFNSNSLAAEIGRFSIETIKDATTEGSELFQIQIREDSYTGPVVLTSPPITINDTSLTSTYIFDSTNRTSIDEDAGAFQFNVITTNTDPGTYLYYTLTIPYGIDVNYFATDLDQSLLPTGKLYIYTYDNGLTGWGKLFISALGDKLTEGPETFQIQLRTSSTSGPIVATSPTITINDTSIAELPVTNSFEYQIVGGGGGVGLSSGTNYSAGGGGGGGFVSSSVLWTDRTKDSVLWQVTVGAAGTTSSLSSSMFTFYAYGGGRGAGTSSAAQSGGSGGGGSAGGGGSVYNVGGAGTPGQGKSGGKAWNFAYSNIGGGGGGYASAGTAGGSGYSGNGGSGTTDWTGTYVSYGGGGKSAGNISGASGSPSGNAPAGSGGGGGGVTGSVNHLGGSGKVIIRYPESYKEPVYILGNPTVYTSGGYRYYVWTSSGNFRFAF